MSRNLLLLTGLAWCMIVLGCATSEAPRTYKPKARQAAVPPAERRAGARYYEGDYGMDYDRERVLQAEAEADAGGRKVLATGRRMAVEDRELVVGACWDYINAIYKRAGFPEGQRPAAFKSVKKGPYADIDLIRPGDWLHIVNHSNNGIEHSAIFVYWEDKAAKQGMMLTYAGGKREVPARYLPYDLSSVYRILRPAGD